MPGSAVHGFTDPDDYAAYLRPWMSELVITRPGVFTARLIQAELPHVSLLRACEVLSRVAFLSLPPDMIFISFPTHPKGLPIWGGIQLRLGDLMFHSRGERLHQVTTGVSFWGCLMIRATTLALYSRALTGCEILAPSIGRVLRPSPPDWQQLLHLHARIGRIVETRPTLLGRPTTAHAMEQEVIEALVPCLAAHEANEGQQGAHVQAQTMVRFQEVITAHAGPPPPLAELCKLVGVSERSLESCCARFLGISADRYLHLRRLTQARAAMLHADAATARIAAIALCYGFKDPGRFAAAYRTAFGETPVATLRRVKNLWH